MSRDRMEIRTQSFCGEGWHTGWLQAPLQLMSQVVAIFYRESPYWIEVPSLPGCFSQDETREEAAENIKEAIALHFKNMIAAREELPADLGLVSVETVDGFLDLL
jgi:predicted RNase H-like HicB family nuclease